MATTSDGRFPIILSHHVLKRVQERYKWVGEEIDLRRRIIADVSQALDAGRIAKRLPACFGRDTLRPVNIPSSSSDRCVWTEDERRGYIIVMRRTRDDGKRIWVVKTALRSLR